MTIRVTKFTEVGWFKMFRMMSIRCALSEVIRGQRGCVFIVRVLFHVCVVG
jgi:hypothetical protein